MRDYIGIIKETDYVSLAFYVDYENIIQLGKKLEAINENAYMNGYNWEALLNCYIEHNCSELSDSFELDSEAGMYSAIFEGSPKGAELADKLAEIIEDLVENEEKLFDFVREYGDEIEWD
mgnify:CR=1 FL=1